MSRGMIRMIRAYQRFSANSTPRCRYLPTCSQYAVEAIDEYGPMRGSWFGVRRIFRCHPFGSHGHDPVPRKG